MKNDLTYSEAIEQVMLNNGYFAPLKVIYKNIWRYKDRSKIKGKTPDYTVQERVQRDERFTRIGLGVYALTEFLEKLPKEIEPKTKKEEKERKHATIQGMLLEIGNLKNEISDTYTNDKKWTFQNKTLGSLATTNSVPPFTYERIIRDSIRFIDVIWFNHRGFPNNIFEVEHSSDFRGAFVKFMELQDFLIDFYCVAPENRIEKFNKEKNKSAFIYIKDRLKFLSYKQVENDYHNRLVKYYIK